MSVLDRHEECSTQHLCSSGGSAHNEKWTKRYSIQRAMNSDEKVAACGMQMSDKSKSNSVASAGLFAGYGHKFGMPAEPGCWPRRGIPRGGFLVWQHCSILAPISRTSRPTHNRLDIMIITKGQKETG